MTRIGRIIAVSSQNQNIPCFQLVVEGGRVVLGCWRFVGLRHDPSDSQPAAIQPAAIFERVS